MRGRSLVVTEATKLALPHDDDQQGRAMKFTGTKDYVATDDLKVAVNASIVLERPLLVKGEPGTGKTVLAEEVAKAVKFAEESPAPKAEELFEDVVAEHGPRPVAESEHE